MDVAELRAAIANLPDDLPVAVYLEDDWSLHPDVGLDIAVEYAPGRRDGRGQTWRWRGGHDPEDDERAVLVIY